jgi:ribosome maturation factor RimP
LNEKSSIIAKVTDLAEGIGRAENIEVVEVQLLGGGAARMLRVYIDKPQGVTHADCELMSHQLGAALDAEDVVPGNAYTLEVSSPGVERKLTKPADFQRFVGKKAKIVLREPVENQTSWIGKLAGFDNDRIKLEPSEGKFVEIALNQIDKANLKFEW